MSDQCPSTVGARGTVAKAGKAELASVSRELATANGMRVWRSLEEVLDTPGFREHLEREFPAGAVAFDRSRAFEGGEAGGEARRDFLKLMGASVALAGAAALPGCRRPDHKIMPYSREVPEEVIPGKPLYYATSYPLGGGGAEGLLVETHEGRPTKIEGNPLHPNNQGRASAFALSSILGLYDPDRMFHPTYANPVQGVVRATWDDFRAWGGEHFARFDAGQGEGLAFVVGRASGVARERQKARVLARWPKATWIDHDPCEAMSEVEGTRAAFGRALTPIMNITIDTARVIVAFDRDFLGGGASMLSDARGFASTRRAMGTHDEMSRLYVVESGYSVTGGQADHRLRLSPARAAAAALELARFVLPKTGQGGLGALAEAIPPAGAVLSAEDRRFVEEAGKDLLDAANRGKGLVLAGATMPAAVHAVVHAINEALGSVGRGVSYVATGKEWTVSSASALGELAGRMHQGKVDTLVCVECNPAYDAPGDVDFAGAMRKVKAAVTLGVGPSETSALSTWALNGSHYLESWGDTRSSDGTIAPIQPMIAPLYEPSMSGIEFLALLASKDFGARVDGYELVREAWRPLVGEGDFEKAWRRALHDGVLAGSAYKAEKVELSVEGVARAVREHQAAPAGTREAPEVVFQAGRVGDGRYANTAWLQELPQTGTMVVWDNPALMSPAMAESLGLSPEHYKESDPSRIYTRERFPEARLAEITVGGRKATMPVWILPGMADNTIVLTLGYGRMGTGKVADGVGVNVYPLRSSGGEWSARGGVARAAGEYEIASTQNHWSMEGRTSIVRVVDVQAWRKHGEATQAWGDKFYGTATTLNFGERLGELTHTPPNISIYKNPLNDSAGEPAAGARYSERAQWGMTIDLTSCTGCGVCTIACQSENNIPVVGKRETAKGREMAWIRVDRYFAGDSFDAPEMMLHQPVACVHCENAPCETVCPVNATIHGPEGLNYMTYNRCIGTRYCANNCPYKVRRYNFFEYGKLQFNGDYAGKETLEKIVPERGGVNGSNVHNKFNINLVPPRLRQQLSELERMGKNPDVTVRMRGVMEKCSYCVQRINEARIECKLADIRDPRTGKAIVPDGHFQTACQQACPSGAIVFGDILDPQSAVSRTRAHARSYALLGFLNTRPRTSHMVRVVNRNPALARVVEDPFHHGGGHEGEPHEPHEPHGTGGGAGHAGRGYRHDGSRKRGDAGYALSLSVLNNGARA